MSVSAPARAATITIPMLPPRECSPNWRGGWAARARAVREFRETAGWAARAAVLDDAEAFTWVYQAREIALDLEIALGKGRRRQDDDNIWASMKGAIDGIADVLGVDDKRFRVGRLVQTRGDGTVTVQLRAVETAGGDGG